MLGLGCDVEGPKLVLLSTLPDGVGVDFLGSADTDVETGFKTWASGLVVWPELGFDPGLKVVEAGRPAVGLGLLTGCGLEVLGGSGLEETGRVDSGLGLGFGLGARMGLIVGFLSTEKGFGVSLGLGPGTGFLGSGLIMRDDWVPGEPSISPLLLESVSGLRCRRLASISTWAAISAPAWLSTVCSGAPVSVATTG